MPSEGRGMIFPPSYYRDQFTPAQEAQMEAEQAAAENRTPAQEASDYFNALPIEQRRKLAPLLEDYRRLGIEEALAEVAKVKNQLTHRSHEIRNNDWSRFDA